MENLSSSDQRRDFFVFVDPNDWLTRHQLALIGSFSSSPADASAPKLMFLPNPEFQTFISPFQNNLVRNYMAEYNLELCREQNFAHYPCRLQAIFLFDTEEEARKYLARHHNHVGGRLLKRCQTIGRYLWSRHDSSWIDFLRVGHSMDAETLQFVGRAYWSGDSVKNHQLTSMGKAWSEDPIMEVLLLGRIDFDDRGLTT
jgi:hypothetical protein